MKTRNLFMAAAAALFLFSACEKEKGNEMIDNTPKSVTLSFTNVFNTKSVDGTPLEKGDAVTCNNFQIFFTDGTTLYEGFDVNNANTINRYYTEAPVNPIQFHYLDPKVNRVIVIGNLDVKKDWKTLAELEGYMREIAYEQDYENLTLYGDDKTLTATTPQPEHTSDHSVYTAEITLVPRIARIEVTGFNYTTDETAELQGKEIKYDSFTLNAIAVNNYYSKLNIDANTLAADGEIVDDIDETSNNYSAEINSYIANTTGWMKDDIRDGKNTVTISNTYNHNLSAKPIYYHFFPLATPEIAMTLVAHNIDKTDMPISILTTGFTNNENQSAVQFEAGYVYKMDFTFNGRRDNWTQQAKCVDVTVEVQPWQVVMVIPEF